MPAVGLVALADVLGERERGVALDRDVVVVVERDQPAEAEVAGERRGLGRRRPPAGRRRRRSRTCSGRRSGGRRRLKRSASMRSASAMPTAFAMPWPSGPVVVSMPAAWPYSGWPAVGLPSWRKCLRSSSVSAVAGEVQHRVEQHRRVARARARSGRGPASAAFCGVVPHDARVEDVRERRERHRRAGVARVRLLDRVHRQGADRVDAELVERLLVRRCRRHLSPPRVGLGQYPARRVRAHVPSGPAGRRRSRPASGPPLASETSPARSPPAARATAPPRSPCRGTGRTRTRRARRRSRCARARRCSRSWRCRRRASVPRSSRRPASSSLGVQPATSRRERSVGARGPRAGAAARRGCAPAPCRCSRPRGSRGSGTWPGHSRAVGVDDHVAELGAAGRSRRGRRRRR